jgi:hypothetical protein
MATRKRRARNADGTLKGDNPATPEVNEAWEQVPAGEEAPSDVIEEAPVAEAEEAPAEEPKGTEPAVIELKETPEAVKREIPTSAKVEKSKITQMLEEKRKDPEVVAQPKDEGLKPMTEERLQEIRQNAVTAASVEKSGVDQIIKDAGVEKTRGREIAARLMYNARKNGGFV